MTGSEEFNRKAKSPGQPHTHLTSKPQDYEGAENLCTPPNQKKRLSFSPKAGTHASTTSKSSRDSHTGSHILVPDTALFQKIERDLQERRQARHEKATGTSLDGHNQNIPSQETYSPPSLPTPAECLDFNAKPRNILNKQEDIVYSPGRTDKATDLAFSSQESDHVRDRPRCVEVRNRVQQRRTRSEVREVRQMYGKRKTKRQAKLEKTVSVDKPAAKTEPFDLSELPDGIGHYKVSSPFNSSRATAKIPGAFIIDRNADWRPDWERRGDASLHDGVQDATPPRGDTVTMDQHKTRLEPTIKQPSTKAKLTENSSDDLDATSTHEQIDFEIAEAPTKVIEAFERRENPQARGMAEHPPPLWTELPKNIEEVGNDRRGYATVLRISSKTSRDLFQKKVNVIDLASEMVGLGAGGSERPSALWVEVEDGPPPMLKVSTTGEKVQTGDRSVSRQLNVRDNVQNAHGSAPPAQIGANTIVEIAQTVNKTTTSPAVNEYERATDFPAAEPMRAGQKRKRLENEANKKGRSCSNCQTTEARSWRWLRNGSVICNNCPFLQNRLKQERPWALCTRKNK